ncbi:MAG: class I SAM-dependent rRNA methyltransferase [bacterium]
MSPRNRDKPSEPAPRPQRRRGVVRIRAEATTRILSGHPWVFRDALRTRGDLPAEEGEIVTLQDPDGRFVAAGFFEREGAVAIRVLSVDPDQPPGPDLYRRRAHQAVDLRQALIPDSTTAYRVINGEGDGLPGVTVDRYGDYLVAQLFSLAAEPLAEAVYPVLMERYGARGLYEQLRLRPTAGERRPAASLKLGKVAPVEVCVTEHGRQFLVDVSAPMGVGLFPDLREARHWVGRHAKGRRVLNTFSYTGAFTVHTAAGGADSVTAVDQSAKVHAWSRKNLRQNGLDPETACEHLTGDVTGALTKLARDNARFDLAIVDPPSFSRSRKGSFSSARDYAELVSQTLTLLAPAALLLAVSNTARLSEDEFARALGRGANQAGRELRLVRRFPLPPDFPVPPAFSEGSYLKAYLCTV